MTGSTRSLKHPLHLKRDASILAAVWTTVILVVLGWHLWQVYRDTLGLACVETSHSFEKDLVYRRWASMRGGVYVPVSKETPPNPYLNVKNRDVTTTSGLHLTLVNPAYMTRQVHELGRKQYGLTSHITSLNPIRPKNAPDPWEAKALRAFERGKTEVAEIEKIGGRDHLRLMRPLFTEASCLKCHAAQGYKQGDLRGGISVSVPMAPLWSVMYGNMARVTMGYVLIWLLGLGGLGLGALRLKRRISERQRAEAALRESEEQYRTILAAAKDAMIAIDQQGRVTMFNPAAEEMFGRKSQDMIGQSLNCLMPEDYRQHHDGYVTGYFTKGEPANAIGKTVERPALRSDGTVFPVEISLSAGQRGDERFVIAVIRDVTERKRAEDALRLAHERLLSIFDSMDESIYVADPETYELLYVNNAIEKGWGKVTGQKCFQALQHRDAPCPFCTNHLILGENIGTTHIWEFRNEVTHRWYRCIDRAIRWSDGRMVRFEMAVDITDAKRADAEHLSLERQVQQAKRLESLGILAGGVAHDFNNLLMVILGNASLVLDMLPADSPLREIVEDIRSASQRAADLTKQMLAYSGKGHFVVGQVDLSKLIEDMAELLRSSVSKKTELQFDLDRSLPAIEADADQMRQILVNCIVNASEAISDNHGTIAVRTRTRECDAAYMRQAQLAEELPQGTYVELEISDNGHGMDKETLEKIFDPFFSTKFVGRGLGLAAVQGIMRGHRGALEVQSQPGKGTTFRFLFPVLARPHGSPRSKP